MKILTEIDFVTAWSAVVTLFVAVCMIVLWLKEWKEG